MPEEAAEAGGGGGAGGGLSKKPKCTYLIRLNNQNKLPPDQLAAIKQQIADLFGPASVGVEFVEGANQKTDAELNFLDPGWWARRFTDDDRGHTYKHSGVSWVHSGVISDAFKSRSQDVKNKIIGTVAAHELIHNLLIWADVPFNSKEKYDIMLANENSGQDYYFVNNLYALTQHERDRLLEDCLLNRRSQRK